jgi:ketosteroid isomerase-like protein
MSVEDNKRLIIDLNEGRELGPDLLTDDFEFLINADPRGHRNAGVPMNATQFVQALRNRGQLIQRIDGKGDGMYREIKNLIGEGDMVAVEAVGRGVLKADPSRSIINRNVSIYEFVDGKIARIRVYEDLAFIEKFFSDINQQVYRSDSD